MTERFGKWPKYLGNGLDTCDTVQYLRSGFTMLEKAEEFDKRFKYVGNDVYIWKPA